MQRITNRLAFKAPLPLLPPRTGRHAEFDSLSSLRQNYILSNKVTIALSLLR